MDERLSQLAVLLPGLESRIMGAPPALIARLACQTDDVARRLMELKALFPQADITEMVNNRLSLLLDDDMRDVGDAGAKLRARLPDINIDRFVQAFPLVLDYDTFEMAIEDLSRIMPGVDLSTLLRSNPGMIMGLAKGKALIPYDQVANPWS
ncbi:hypothetical protein FOA52_003209 [Chlamydomonas sp. UWO 241]|nr:hypothetical protein FOA52_003209 [Chlamydomonas sp. UWO 241]